MKLAEAKRRATAGTVLTAEDCRRSLTVKKLREELAEAIAETPAKVRTKLECEEVAALAEAITALDTAIGDYTIQRVERAGVWVLRAADGIEYWLEWPKADLCVDLGPERPDSIRLLAEPGRPLVTLTFPALLSAPEASHAEG